MEWWTKLGLETRKLSQLFSGFKNTGWKKGPQE